MGRWRGVELESVELSTDRLTLRPWRLSDASAVATIMTDPAMHAYLPLPQPYTIVEAAQFVGQVGADGRRGGTALSAALVAHDTRNLVGAIELRLPGPRQTSAELGYWVAGPTQGRGYGTEAVRAMTEWAFTHGAPRVQIRCAVGNLASAIVAMKAGYPFEAVLRNEVLTTSGPADAASFARLPADRGEPIPAWLPPLPASGLGDGVIMVRCQQAGDAPAVSAEHRNEQARRWGLSDPPELAQVEADCAAAALRWLVGPVARMAIVDIAAGQVAGTIQLRQTGPPGVAGIGYGVLPEFRGRGYTARALRLLADWAFKHAGLVRLELGAKAGNIASQKAALSGGFVPDGVRRMRLRNTDGTFSDEVRFALVDSPTATR